MVDIYGALTYLMIRAHWLLWSICFNSKETCSSVLCLSIIFLWIRSEIFLTAYDIRKTMLKALKNFFLFPCPSASHFQNIRHKGSKWDDIKIFSLFSLLNMPAFCRLLHKNYIKIKHLIKNFALFLYRTKYTIYFWKYYF